MSQTPSQQPQPDEAAGDFSLSALAHIPDPLSLGEAERAPAAVPALPKANTRAELRLRQSLLLGAAGVWVFGRLAYSAWQGSFSALPVWYLLTHAGLPIALGLGVMFLSLRSGQGLGTRTGSMQAAALGGASLLWLLAMLLPSLGSSGSAPSAVKCMTHTSVGLLLPLGLVALAVRNCFPAGARWRSAGLGASVGLFAGALTNLACSAGSQLHLALGHASPAVLTTIVGGALIARVARA